jgi:hypothetical protein
MLAFLADERVPIEYNAQFPGLAIPLTDREAIQLID